MCKPLNEGGQRCASHAKDRLERKAQAMREAADWAAERGPEGMQHFNQAREAWESAAIEYASTPAGAEVLTARLAVAEEAQDGHTSAMLTTILSRGEAMREANAQVRAALALGAFMETSLPEPERASIAAADETGNPLSEDEQRAWLALVDAVTGKADDSHSGEVRYFLQGLTEADARIASSASDDRVLARAVKSLSLRGAQWVVRSAAEGHGDILQTQARRALHHPNASEHTWFAACTVLPLQEVVAMPQCPDPLLMRLNTSDVDKFDDQTWKALRGRAEQSVPAAVLVATCVSDEGMRDDARMILSGVRWDSVPAEQLPYVRKNLAHALGEHAARVDESLVKWVRYFGDESTKASVLTDAERGVLTGAGSPT